MASGIAELAQEIIDEDEKGVFRCGLCDDLINGEDHTIRFVSFYDGTKYCHVDCEAKLRKLLKHQKKQ
jgi:hypothetical protein